MTNQVEYSSLGRGWDGKPLLRQQGPKKMVRFYLRFVTVDAASESAAKKIQSAWREAQKQSDA